MRRCALQSPGPSGGGHDRIRELSNAGDVAGDGVPGTDRRALGGKSRQYQVTGIQRHEGSQVGEDFLHTPAEICGTGRIEFQAVVFDADSQGESAKAAS